MAEDPPLRGCVLISYAHGSDEHDAAVARLYHLLRSEGIDARIDRAAEDLPNDWALWTEREIGAAERVLVVCSQAYRERFEMTAPPGEGRGVRWEARYIREAAYRDQEAGRSKFLPVLLPGATVEDIPTMFGPYSSTHYRVDGFTVDGALPLIRLLTGQPAWVEPPLGRPTVLPPVNAPAIVIRIRIGGGDPIDRDRAVRAAMAHVIAGGGAAHVQFDDNSAVAGAVLLLDPDDRHHAAGPAVRGLCEAMTPGLAATLGIYIAPGSDPTGADDLARSEAATAMHRRPGAGIVIAASHAFHRHLTDGDEHFPDPAAYAERPWGPQDSRTCWIAVPGETRCPPPPPTRPAGRSAGPPPPAPIGGVWINQGDHGSVMIGNVYHFGGER